MEQLINIQVTSVSKKQTDLFQSPAAIYVITQEDIRRSGLTSIPELLRMVPGLDVARIDGNEWAVTSRGFNREFAKQMLVLIDGRTIYSPTSAGIYWNAQDVVLEDIDRIEVIRGPGATLWGANAVNGVINIITKSAKETQGGLVSAAAGTEDQPSSTVRYGGQIATNLYYRAYVRYFNREGLIDSTGHETADDWHMLRGGSRIDWEPSGENNLTLQGDYYTGAAEKGGNQISLSPVSVQTVHRVQYNAGFNVLSRWTHTFSEESALTLQTYYDHVKQGDGNGIEYQDTYDVDLQHHFKLGERNDIVWGTGYRYIAVQNISRFNLTWTPENKQLRTFEIFLQDDITLIRDRLHFTLGSKFEHNDFTGWEIQPSGRLLWTPTERQTVWSAVSRAVRTPSLFETSGRLNLTAFQPPLSPPVLVSLLPNPKVDSEKLVAYELGYRIEPIKRLSFDIAGFYNVYDDLIAFVADPIGFEPNPPPPHLLRSSTEQNALAGETYGTELSTQWQVTDHWQLVGSYTWLHMHLRPNPVSEADSPQQQFQIRSYLDLPHNLELNGAVYYVDQIKPISGATRAQVPSYVRLDLGIVWHPTKSLEISLWGQNLLDNQHPEFGSVVNALFTEVPRSFYGKVTWRF